MLILSAIHGTASARDQDLLPNTAQLPGALEQEQGRYLAQEKFVVRPFVAYHS